MVSAVKQSEDGEGLLVRVFNPIGTPAAAAVAPGFAAVGYQMHTRAEEVRAGSVLAGDRVQVDPRPKRIETVVLVADRAV